MSLANVAWILAEKYYKNVLIVDWDLEAPGLHRFFNIDDKEIEYGLIDLFYDYKEVLRSDISTIKEEIVNIDKYIKKISNNSEGSISILPAGRQDGEYSTRVNNFDWHEFYENWHGFGFIEFLKEQLKKRSDIILIDSRTGVTDIGGICTLQMPDAVVLLFSLNEQSISGTEIIIKNILKESTNIRENEFHPKLIIIPSRVEIVLEKEELNLWWKKAAKRFEKYLPNTNKNEDALNYIINNSIPYIGYYSFGEKLAVKDDQMDPIAKSFYNLTLKISEAADYNINPKVFISYSHDSQELIDEVLTLSDRLRTDGIDCTIDQYETSPPEGWARWEINQINKADFVLVVCTEIYKRRFESYTESRIEEGAFWEGAIISRELYESEIKNTKFIPIILSQNDAFHIPMILQGVNYFNPNTDEGYTSFYRYLTGQPRIVKPELFKLRVLPTLSRRKDFHTPFNIPFLRNPYFTGREKVLEQLHYALKSDKTATSVQAISGLGGIGKTLTAVEYAYKYRSEYKAVLWVKADSSESLISDYAALSQVLDIPEKDAKEHNLSVVAVKHWLEINSGWLLIFDNADNPELVKNYIPTNLKGHIILTSRAQVFDKIGIVYPLQLETMSPDEAKHLLLKRTGSNNLETADMNAVEQLAKELDYLPLALEQAGAYIHKIKCSFHDYLTSYRKRGLELLEQTKVVADKYPKSVATTWLLNFEQVERNSKASADLLQASAFLNPYDIPLELLTIGAPELGEAICSELLVVDTNPLILDELLLPLSQYSLISRDFSKRTYSIHRLIQVVLRDRLGPDAERLWAERIVRAVNRVFPDVEFSTWSLCNRILPNAQVCAGLIKKWGFEFQETALLLNKAGFYQFERAQYADAEQMYRHALIIKEKTLGLDHPDVAVSLNNLAELYRAQGKFSEADPLYRRALAIQEKVLGPDHPAVAVSLNNLAELYRAQGKYTEVEQMYRCALAIQEKVLGPDHPDVAASLNNLAGLYQEQGKYIEVEQMYRRALAIQEKVLGPDHPFVAASLNNLAGLYQTQGKYTEAEGMCRRALAIYEKVLGPDNPDVAASLNNLAGLYQVQGKYTEAEEMCRLALAIYEKSLGPDNLNLAKSLNNLASLYYVQGKYAKAKPMYMCALAIYEKSLGKDHPDVAKILINYSSFLRKINCKREAAKIEASMKAKLR